MPAQAGGACQIVYLRQDLIGAFEADIDEHQVVQVTALRVESVGENRFFTLHVLPHLAAHQARQVDRALLKRGEICSSEIGDRADRLALFKLPISAGWITGCWTIKLSQ